MTRWSTIGLGVALAFAIGVGVFAGAGTAGRADAPKNRVHPAVRGTAQEGSVLQADVGRWSGGSLDYSFQWRRCAADGSGCVDIAKATDSIYAVVVADVDHAVRVDVTARNRDGADAAPSSPTAAVVALPAEAPHNSVLPAITGSPTPGQLLTASSGTWTGTGPFVFSYRWRRCDAAGGDCADTTIRTQTYGLSQADAGHALRVLASATNAAGTAASLSTPSPLIPRPGKPAGVASPTISGSAQEGKTLTGSRGTWTNSPTAYDYRWQRCNRSGGSCNGIDGARAISYTLAGADVGHTIRFAVTARNASGSTTTLSAPTGIVTAAIKPVPARPQNVTPPRISGTAQQGSTLSADRGTWTNDPKAFDLAWTRCDEAGANCTGISGAHGTTYSPTSADVGHTLRFKVTAKNAGGGTTAYSVPTAVVAAPPVSKVSPPALTSPPTILGTAQDGRTLTGNRGSWSNSPTDYDYSWRRCDRDGNGCNGIGGAHATTYNVSGADVGHTLRFRVTAKNADGSSTATSAPTGVVKAAAKPDASSPPTVSGTPQEGKTLTGNRGNWKHDPTDFNYAWLRCDHNGGSCAAIGGANGTTYTLKSPDVGATLRFRVKAKNSEGSTTAASAPTAVIQRAVAPPPPPPVRPVGCPPGGNPDQVANIGPPARLLIDTLQSNPRVVTRGTRTLVVRFHVTSTCGGPVQGALVYATATPYNQFSIPPEAATDSDGWATLVFTRLQGFPVSPRQQLITMFVRARKPGENPLVGISTRRLFSLPVSLG